eukprot:11512404-Alexandrium_andersonii.AAC.1
MQLAPCSGTDERAPVHSATPLRVGPALPAASSLCPGCGSPLGQECFLQCLGCRPLNVYLRAVSWPKAA